MDNCTVMRREIKGIQLLVVLRNNSYDVYLDITPEANISKKIVGKGFTLKIRFSDNRKAVNNAFHIQILNKRYKDSEIANNSKTVVKNEDYCIELSLYPCIYVLPSKAYEAQEKQKSKKIPKKKISTNGLKKPGLASSKLTKYSQSNISRPYSGGRCTPK